MKESRKRESLSTCWRHNEGPLVKPFTAEGDYKVTEELGMAISVLKRSRGKRSSAESNLVRSR